VDAVAYIDTLLFRAGIEITPHRLFGALAPIAK
jgi:hypothetical protein